MNLEKLVGLIFIILMGLIIFIFVLSPQPKYQDSISYQLAPNARGLSKDDFDMYVVRVNVFENEENVLVSGIPEGNILLYKLKEKHMKI